MYDQCLLCHGNCSPHRIFDVLPCLLISSGAWCIIELRTALWKHIESKLLHTTQIFLIKQPRPKLLFNYPGSSSALLPTADMQRAMLETLSYTDGASIKRAPSICNVPKQR